MMMDVDRRISPVAEPQSQPKEEKRQDARRRGSHAVWIALGVGMPVRECVLWNESEGGANLSPRAPNEFDLGKIPDVFFIYMSPDVAARSRRRCQVMWRSGTHIGVKFLPDAAKAPGQSPVSRNAAES
jgi:hypothetical protein